MPARRQFQWAVQHPGLCTRTQACKECRTTRAGDLSPLSETRTYEESPSLSRGFAPWAVWLSRGSSCLVLTWTRIVVNRPLHQPGLFPFLQLQDHLWFRKLVPCSVKDGGPGKHRRALGWTEKNPVSTLPDPSIALGLL